MEELHSLDIEKALILDVINGMDELFSSANKWTKGWYAKDDKGNKCLENADTACCYCLIGGAIKVSPQPKHPTLASRVGESAIRFLCDLVNAKDITSWNDAPERTFADVKNLLKNAKEKILHT